MVVTSTIIQWVPRQIDNALYVTFVTITFSATLSFMIVYYVMSNIVIFDEEPYSILKDFKLKNVNRIICGAQLNIKFDQLSSMISGIIDILVITETK